MGQAAEPGSVIWSPDGKYLLACTVAPTFNAANKVQIFKYNGLPLFQKDFKVLYGAVWRCGNPKMYPNPKMSPRGMKEGRERIEKKQKKVSDVYVPPHLKRLQGK